MNWIALLLIALGFGLIIIGWNGSYANVWYYLTGSQTIAGGPPPEPPQPKGGTQTTPPQVPPAGHGQGNSGNGYSLDLGNHLQNG